MSESNIEINNENVEQEVEINNENVTINSGTGNYNNLTNKPTINNVELIGNKTTEDLGIEIPVIPENISAFNNDVGYLTEHQDISGKLDKTSVKTETSTTTGDVYDVNYINTMLGDIESLLGGI